MATGLKRKKRVAQTAQETEIDSNRSQETASGTPQRRGGRRRRACSCPVALGSRNASDERRNRRWVWRMGKARRDGDGVTGELVLEQGRGIKRSKQHEAAVQRVSPLPSTGILCFGGRGRQQHHATTGRNALAGRHGKAASGDLVPAIPAGGRPAVGGKGKVKLCRAPIMASASQPLN